MKIVGIYRMGTTNGRPFVLFQFDFRSMRTTHFFFKYHLQPLQQQQQQQQQQEQTNMGN